MKHLFIEKIKNSRNYTFEQLEGVDAAGNPQFAFGVFNKAHFDDIANDLYSGNIKFNDLDKHGVIIYEGSGKPTHEDVQKAHQIFKRDCLA